MQLLSKRLESVKTSATAKIHNLVLKKRLHGDKIINLAVGEPNFDTPQNIKNAAYSAIKNGHTRYTATGGLDQLKAAILNKLFRDNSLSYKKNELIICSGGKQVIFNALVATLNYDDEVIIPSPYWVSYPDMVRLCGGTPIFINTKLKNSFKITPSDLKKALNPKTKWFILNSPCNPSGSVYTINELTEIGKILELFPHVNILSDDIYEHIIYDNLPFRNLVQINPSLKNRTLLVNGLSKSHAMTGWRIGYGAGNETLVAAMLTVQSQSTSNASSISQYAAIEALEGPQHLIEKNKFGYQKRRDLLISNLSNSNKIKISKPMGAFYALPSIEKLIGKYTLEGNQINSDEDFVYDLLKKTGVAVVPGSAFGAKNYFRISYAVSDTLLKHGCDLIVNFVETLK